MRTPAREAELPNAARPEQRWWTQADEALYLQATTATSAHAQGQPLQDVQVGQVVYLYAGANGARLDQAYRRTCLGHAVPACQPTWQVNSPDALVESAGRSIYPVDRVSLQEHVKSPVARFVASRPGVYTVRATWLGRHSLPLVLTVALDELKTKHTDIPDEVGVTREPASRLARDPILATSPGGARPNTPSQITIGEPVEGWIPVYGEMTGSVSHVAVYINAVADPHRQVWNYQLPVTSSGEFSAALAIPYTGLVVVTVYRVSFNPVTRRFGRIVPQLRAFTDNTSPSLSRRDLMLLPSFFIDYNMPDLSTDERRARAIWENSPDSISARAAASNFVAESVRYDFSGDRRSSRLPTEAADQTLQAGTGVCQNYAWALAALFRSLGQPTIQASGFARWSPSLGWGDKTAGVSSHEWVLTPSGQAGYWPYDPTWDSAESTPLDWIANAFNADTDVLRVDHRTREFRIGL